MKLSIAAVSSHFSISTAVPLFSSMSFFLSQHDIFPWCNPRGGNALLCRTLGSYSWTWLPSTLITQDWNSNPQTSILLLVLFKGLPFGWFMIKSVTNYVFNCFQTTVLLEFRSVFIISNKNTSVVLFFCLSRIAITRDIKTMFVSHTKCQWFILT